MITCFLWCSDVPDICNKIADQLCCRGPGASNCAAELDHARNELVLVATRNIQCAPHRSSDTGC